MVLVGMCGSRKFCQRGPTLITFFFLSIFLVDEGRKEPNATISRPSFRLRADGGPTLSWLGSFVIFQGIRTSIA